jgi:hypothetical protein
MIITEKDVHSNEKRGPVREEIKNIHLRILPNKQRIEQLAQKPLRVSASVFLLGNEGTKKIVKSHLSL